MNNNNPTVFTTGESAKSNKKWFQTWRIIYPVLGIVVVVELILGFKTLFASVPAVKYQSLKPITGAKILLISPKTDFKIGEQIPVKVRVSTGGNTTSGTDLILQYDPKILETNLASIKTGNIYDDYPATQVDAKTGIIRVSGVTSAGRTGFNGGGDLVTINFRAKAAGKTTLAVDFKKGMLNDSNVIKAGDTIDVLEAVEKLELMIQ